jgi:hypothetical protein
MLTEKDRREIAETEFKTKPRVLSSEQVAWAYSKWCLGYTVAEIAKALYVCDRTLWREFKARGLEKRRPPLVYDGK